MILDSISAVVASSWAVTADMAPYLLFGFLVAGVLSVFLSPAWVARVLGGRGWAQVFRASLLGVPLPLCSCGVLPVAASLRQQGASRGATAAFLLSTPQTGVDSMAVTYALLGPFLAVFRPVAAFLSGVLGGWLVQLFDDRPEVASGAPAADGDGGTCCSSPAAVAPAPRPLLADALRHGFVTLPRDIGPALLVGIVLAGLLSALVPADLLSGAVGDGLLPMLLALAIGVPLYVCATASTPIALGLIHAGLSPGAALVFLISGPATNVAALTTLVKVLGRRATALYLVTVVATALASGLAADLVADRWVPAAALVGGSVTTVDHGDHRSHGGDEPVSLLGHAAALALLVVMGASRWSPRAPLPTADRPVFPAPMLSVLTAERERGVTVATQAAVLPGPIVLAVEGMHCAGCVTGVTRAIEACAGVDSVVVDLARREATVTGARIDGAEILARVRGLGFEVGNPEVLAPTETCYP